MEGDQLETILSEAVESHPEPRDTGAGVREEIAQAAPGGPVVAPTTDLQRPLLSRKGEQWNAEIHVSPPSETARGTWRKLGPGAAQIAGQIAGGESPDQAAQRTCDQVFNTATPLLDMLCPLPDPTKWAPSDDERHSMESALSRFYAAHPEYMIDLPPGMALVLAVSAYAIPRLLVMPAAQAFIGRFIGAK